MWPFLLACTFEPGRGFTALDEATLRLVLEPGAARDLGEHRVLTDQGYEVEVQLALVEVDRIELQELRGGAVDFDPASPPPGYSLCHNGHCHADDGTLPTYAEIEARLAGDSASFVPVVQLPIEAAVDLWEGEQASVAVEDPWLPEVTLSRAALVVSGLELELLVGGGALLADWVPVSVDLPLEIAFANDLAFGVDRDAPARVAFESALVFDGSVFDGIDFAAQGGVETQDPAHPLAQALVLGLQQTRPSFSLQSLP